MIKPMFAGALAMPALLLGTGTVAGADSGVQAFQVQPEVTSTEWTLALDGNPVFVYRYEEVPRKPYLKEWYSPAGLNMLRDAPADHLHHHGMMFAIKVNGVNFWEETEGSGTQVHQDAHALRAAGEPDTQSHGFEQELVWRGPDADAPLLIERRSIEHSPLSNARVRMLTWQSSLRSAETSDAAMVTLGGNIYHGLGMRFPAFMDQTGTFFMANDKTGAFEDGPNHRLAQASWCAYTVDHPDHPVTVAMFHCPDNPRPTLWFTMREPFAYLSATQDLMRAPMELSAGEELSFRHGVAAWDAVVEEGEIEAAYRAWLETLR